MQYFLCSREFKYLSSLKHFLWLVIRLIDRVMICIKYASSTELEEKDFLGRSNSGFDIQFFLDIFNF